MPAAIARVNSRAIDFHRCPFRRLPCHTFVFGFIPCKTTFVTSRSLNPFPAIFVPSAFWKRGAARSPRCVSGDRDGFLPDSPGKGRKVGRCYCFPRGRRGSDPPGPFPSGFNLIGTSFDLFSLYRILPIPCCSIKNGIRLSF